MNVLYGLLIAVSMYSKVPVPLAEWTKPRMRYAMCWFPVVGLVCGGLLWLWFCVSGSFGFHPGAAGLVGVCIPVLVTGGIHLDGFLDTLDARSSYGNKEKKLEILKDPHTGAFAIIGACVYFMLYAACLIQLFIDGRQMGQERMVAAFCLVFSLERAFSGFSVASFRCAKNSGLVHTFSDGAHKQVTRIVLLLWMAVLFAMLTLTGWLPAAAVFGTGGVVFWYYWHMSKKEFGGITGDLAGWFLQVFELTALAALMVCARWMAGQAG